MLKSSSIDVRRSPHARSQALLAASTYELGRWTHGGTEGVAGGGDAAMMLVIAADSARDLAAAPFFRAEAPRVGPGGFGDEEVF